MKKQELFNNVTEGFPYQRQPQQMGLYDAAYEHDACGVGMLVNIHEHLFDVRFVCQSRFSQDFGAGGHIAQMHQCESFFFNFFNNNT